MNRDNILTVSQLTQHIKGLLEGAFPLVWVSGEISNFIRHRSGHLYFSLKDERAEIRCVMFRGHNQFLNFEPDNGMQVLLQGRLSVYEPRGQYQLLAQRMEPAGIGTLYLAFEALKKRLREEGLFDEDRKRPLPSYPQVVGVITSSEGAALKDIVTVLTRRAPQVEIILRPTLVQGEQAAADIVAAIEEMESSGWPEVLIVGRGGGSLEDLWPFNEEPVARAMAACKIPIISAVGHETDFTIADLVADVRAPTPSAAAEIVIPARDEILAQVQALDERLSRTVAIMLERYWQQVDHITERLLVQQPGRQMVQLAEQVGYAQRQLIKAFRHRLQLFHSWVEGMEKELQVLNPHQVLDRGYAIAFREVDGAVIRTPADIKNQERFLLHLAQGKLQAEKVKTIQVTKNDGNVQG
jgi:exodeoxyribonuclease VII large subunit